MKRYCNIRKGAADDDNNNDIDVQYRQYEMHSNIIINPYIIINSIAKSETTSKCKPKGDGDSLGTRCDN